MVTSAHEGMHRIFQERPEILTPVFEVLSVESPEKAAVDAIVSDVTEAKPLARHVDTVLRVTAADGDAFLLAVEAQERRDPKKESSWPYYIAYLKSKYGLPVLLLVACRDRATAKWAAGPFQCGVRGWTAQRTYPLVVSPDNIPPITDERTAAEKPAMAAFSALVHANSPDIDVILDALARALARLDPDVSDYIYQFLDAALGNSPAGEKWRNLVSFVNYFPGRGTVMERAYLDGKAEGKARGEAKGILRMLQYRGLPISDQVRERITTCTDLDRLDDWLERAGTVERAEDLFDAASEAPPTAPEWG
ncbi:hypothetical protein [Streptomyces sp. SA15]|uniref:hypothetical protein n=1 Tax=Streptomyces sp. SA15 TaxID=934019 RepID=UPI00211BD920|nr:hypothetical protein [Streptomyces sp. SA15]